MREVLDLLRQDPDHGVFARAQYLLWSGARLQSVQARHQARLETLAPADAAAEATTTALESLQTALATSNETQLRQALDAGRPALESLLTQADHLDALAAPHYRVEDWRQIGQLSADVILEERRLYTAARA